MSETGMAAGRTIVVTGASSGIGKATAELLLESGYGVVATARDADRLNSIYGDRAGAHIIPWNLSEPEGIGDYAKAVHAAVGAIGGLVHSAGVFGLTPSYLIKPSVIDSIFHINTYAGMLLVSSFMKKGRYGEGASFVLISSLSAHRGVVGGSVYAASKAALEGFTIAAAPELADKNARINCIAPGTVESPMTSRGREKLDDAQIAAQHESYPLGIGTPADIGNFAEYLISDRAKWITGRTFVLDGGHLARK
ncbi:MAG: SDR family oxidoreductase [Clostridiales Family XIII bacterium]|nr:SDR family oxidoreductase [Clostridiales Family XIII bacterium]